MPYFKTAPDQQPPNIGIGPFMTAGGLTASFTFTPAVTAGAYSAGNVVGGMIAVPGAVRPGVLSGILYGLCILAKSNTAPPLTLYFLRNAQQGGLYTDNAALTWNVNDFADVIATHTIAAADWISAGSKQAVSYGGIGKPIVLASTLLYVLPIATGSFTPTGTTDYTFILTILQD